MDFEILGGKNNNDGMENRRNGGINELSSIICNKIEEETKLLSHLFDLKNTLDKECIITPEDTKKIEDTLNKIGDKYSDKDVMIFPWIRIMRSGLASMASQKSRFDIVDMLFDYESTTALDKLDYLIRYFPNDDVTVQKIESILAELDDKVIKEYRHKDDRNSFLDLSCGKSPNIKTELDKLYDDTIRKNTSSAFKDFDFSDVYQMLWKESIPKPEIVKILISRGMGMEDMFMLDFDSPECLHLVLFENHQVRAHVESIINKKDPYNGYTALHKAAQRRCQESVRYLLKAGASFGTVNDFGESCISQIDPKILEKFLDDDCIKTNSETNILNDDKDFELIFDYR